MRLTDVHVFAYSRYFIPDSSIFVYTYTYLLQLQSERAGIIDWIINTFILDPT